MVPLIISFSGETYRILHYSDLRRAISRENAILTLPMITGERIFVIVNDLEDD